jgi:hypothetical protein
MHSTRRAGRWIIAGMSVRRCSRTDANQRGVRCAPASFGTNAMTPQVSTNYVVTIHTADIKTHSNRARMAFVNTARTTSRGAWNRELRHPLVPQRLAHVAIFGPSAVRRKANQGIDFRMSPV